MQNLSDEELRQLSKEVRKEIMTMIYNAGSGHPGGSLSCVEILTSLFFNSMSHDPSNPSDPNRDRFVLSKGHAAPAYYTVLAKSGYLHLDELNTLRKFESRLQGHPDKSKFPLMETTSGSLGQGLSIAAGIAFGLRLDKKDSKVYCLLGDGELDEGQVWESLATIKKYNLSNLIAIIDNNKAQLDGMTSQIKDLGNIAEKFASFGHTVIEVDGHDIQKLNETFANARILSDSGKNVIIIAHTIKGKGVSFMENNVAWHGKAPNAQEYDAAMKELG